MSRSGGEASGWLSALLLGWAFLLAGSAARGQDPAGGAAAVPPQERTPVQWLKAIRSAAQRTNYTGTIVYQRGDEVRSSSIVHFFDGTTARERVQTLDGRPREFIREGDEVHCLYPRQRRVVIEQGRLGSHAVFPALGQIGVSRVLEHYELSIGEVERVAGVECRTLHLVPRDSLRYGYRLWVHPASGLLLKVQVVGADDSMIEQIAFSDVRIGQPIDPAQLRPTWSTTGWEVVRHPSHEIELSRQGWSFTAPEGFHRLTEVERELGNDSQETLQAVYTDGLATVSVFIEPGAAPADPEPVQHRGPWSAFMRRVGDARVTVVGEVPPTTVQSIADSVKFVAAH